MGQFNSPGRNQYYWRLLQYLQDDSVYSNDKQTIPFTPAQQPVYTALFPELYSVFPPTVLSVYINGKLAGSGNLTDPSGLLYVAVNIPRGEFLLEVRDAGGRVLTNEMFEAKNYAMFFDVAAQSYEDRRIAIEQVRQDQSYATIRTGRVYPVVGAFFGFPPPPGWTSDEYRATVLGDGVCKPGFVNSFFMGGTKLGVLDSVKSIVGCADVEILPPDDGNRWVLFDLASAPDPVVGGAEAWYISDTNIALPEHRIVINDTGYFASAGIIRIHSADRTVTDEQVYKVSNSYIESAFPEPYVLAGKTLTFSVEDLGDITTFMSFSTTFVAATTAAQAAAEILAQNPSLGSAVYAQAGKLRIGVPPEPATTREVAIVGGSALADLGWVAGQAVDVANDFLANAYPTSPVVITFGTDIFNDGVDFEVMQTTGEIVWDPSTLALPNVPPAGSVMLASYTYVPQREVSDIVDKSKSISDLVEIEFVTP
jgi:hypothetical protein